MSNTDVSAEPWPGTPDPRSMYVLIVEAERPDGDRCIDEVLGPMTLDAVSFRFGIRLAELITAGELVAPTVTVAALVDWRQRDRPTRVINVVDSL